MGIVPGRWARSLEVNRLELRWIFFVWGTIAAALMALALAQNYGFVVGSRGDAAIGFALFTLIGLPAWLIVAALTVYRWKDISGKMVAIQNAPAFVAAVMFAVAVLVAPN